MPTLPTVEGIYEIQKSGGVMYKDGLKRYSRFEHGEWKAIRKTPEGAMQEYGKSVEMYLKDPHREYKLIKEL